MFYLNKFCLLCLSNYKKLRNIALPDNDGISIEEKLECFLLEAVQIEPEIPKYICGTCTNDVNYIYKYRQICLKNVAVLKQYLEKLSVKTDKFKGLSVKIDDIKYQKKKRTRYRDNNKQIIDRQDLTTVEKRISDQAQDESSQPFKKIRLDDTVCVNYFILLVNNQIQNQIVPPVINDNVVNNIQIQADPKMEFSPERVSEMENTSKIVSKVEATSIVVPEVETTSEIVSELETTLKLIPEVETNLKIVPEIQIIPKSDPDNESSNTETNEIQIKDEIDIQEHDLLATRIQEIVPEMETTSKIIPEVESNLKIVPEIIIPTSDLENESSNTEINEIQIKDEIDIQEHDLLATRIQHAAEDHTVDVQSIKKEEDVELTSIDCLLFDNREIDVTFANKTDEQDPLDPEDYLIIDEEKEHIQLLNTCTDVSTKICDVIVIEDDDELNNKQIKTKEIFEELGTEKEKHLTFDGENNVNEDKNEPYNGNSEEKQKQNEIIDLDPRKNEVPLSSHKCNECNKIFWTMKKLKKHEKRHLKLKPPPVKCPDCDKVCKTLLGVHIHLKKAHLKYQLSCPNCSWICKTRKQLKEHFLRHESPLKCNECDFACFNHNDLKKHELTHTESILKCHLCPCIFFTHYSLSNHLQMFHFITSQPTNRNQPTNKNQPTQETTPFTNYFKKKIVAKYLTFKTSDTKIDHSKSELSETNGNQSCKPTIFDQNTTLTSFKTIPVEELSAKNSINDTKQETRGGLSVIGPKNITVQETIEELSASEPIKIPNQKYNVVLSFVNPISILKRTTEEQITTEDSKNITAQEPFEELSANDSVKNISNINENEILSSINSNPKQNISEEISIDCLKNISKQKESGELCGSGSKIISDEVLSNSTKQTTEDEIIWISTKNSPKQTINEGITTISPKNISKRTKNRELLSCGQKNNSLQTNNEELLVSGPKNRSKHTAREKVITISPKNILKRTNDEESSTEGPKNISNCEILSKLCSKNSSKQETIEKLSTIWLKNNLKMINEELSASSSGPNETTIGSEKNSKRKTSVECSKIVSNQKKNEKLSASDLKNSLQQKTATEIIIGPRNMSIQTESEESYSSDPKTSPKQTVEEELTAIDLDIPKQITNNELSIRGPENIRNKNEEFSIFSPENYPKQTTEEEITTIGSKNISKQKTNEGLSAGVPKNSPNHNENEEFSTISPKNNPKQKTSKKSITRIKNNFKQKTNEESSFTDLKNITLQETIKEKRVTRSRTNSLPKIIKDLPNLNKTKIRKKGKRRKNAQLLKKIEKKQSKLCKDVGAKNQKKEKIVAHKTVENIVTKTEKCKITIPKNKFLSETKKEISLKKEASANEVPSLKTVEGTPPIVVKINVPSLEQMNNMKKFDLATESKLYQCDFCAKIVLGLKTLHNHINEHLAVKPILNCNDCQHTFRGIQINKLENLDQKEPCEKPYCCTYCTEKFCTPNQMYEHRLKVHGYKFILPSLNC